MSMLLRRSALCLCACVLIWASAVRADSVTTFYSFGSGSQSPFEGLFYKGGYFYGTGGSGGPSNLGTIYRVKRSNAQEQVLSAFPGGSGGEVPVTALSPSGAALYGATLAGGASGLGTVFKGKIVGGLPVVATIHSFAGGASDGASPTASLIVDGGYLYGTTERGGPSDQGTAFKMDLAGNLVWVHAFTGADGQYPEAPLIKVGNWLYGTASAGGAHGRGAIVRIDAATGTGSVIYSFRGLDDGAQPMTALTSYGGALLGTASDGGNGDSGGGTVFRINTDGSGMTVLYTFAGGTDGENPRGPVLPVSAGIGSPAVLYGTTQRGGANGEGTIYKLTFAGTKTTLFDFGDVTGRFPQGSLIEVGGAIYGTTVYGGSAGAGTIFAVTP